MDALITFCSERKNKVMVRALDIYDGVIFKMLHKYKGSLDIYILSARYGLISGEDIIYDYEYKMTKDRSQELKTEVNIKLNNIIDNYDNIYINLGKLYLQTLNHNNKFIYIFGGIGKRLSIVKKILDKYKDGKQIRL